MKKKLFYLAGWVSFGLGFIGVAIPILPTTPFLLLSVFLFTKSSTKREEWVKETKVYRKYVVPFLEKGGLDLRSKFEIIGLSYLVLLISGVFVSNLYVRFLLLFIAINLLVVICRIPTAKK